MIASNPHLENSIDFIVGDSLYLSQIRLLLPWQMKSIFIILLNPSIYQCFQGFAGKSGNPSIENIFSNLPIFSQVFFRKSGKNSGKTFMRTTQFLCGFPAFYHHSHFVFSLSVFRKVMSDVILCISSLTSSKPTCV